MEEKTDYKKAFDYSIRLLSLRDYSIHKMKSKLKERGINPIISEEVINKLLDYNYIREDEYKRMRTKQLIVKGFSDSYIIQKLLQEELYTHLTEINDLRIEQNLHCDDQIRYLIEKKIRHKEIPSDYDSFQKLKLKIVNFLASKGYKYNQINNHIEEILNARS